MRKTSQNFKICLLPRPSLLPTTSYVITNFGMTRIISEFGKSLNGSSLKKLFSCSFRKLHAKMNPQSQGEQNALHVEYINKIKEFIPKLDSSLHKGQCGRIGIIGGSAEYTGAPYFAAISALKTGADVVYVFCCRDAAFAIKSYSPELIVLPILDSDEVVKAIEPWLNRLHALVIGPGLGRDPALLRNTGAIINHCKTKMNSVLPLIIDADGLFVVAEDISLTQDYGGPVILTPNANEFNILSAKLSSGDLVEVAAEFNSTIVLKGSKDIITNSIFSKKFNLGSNTIVSGISGSNRRCGGQGDVLAGSMATFVAWLQLSRLSKFSGSKDFNNLESKFNAENKEKWFEDNLKGYSLAAYGACALTKTCSKLAFNEFGRSMTTTNMISYIQKAFTTLFGE